MIYEKISERINERGFKRRVIARHIGVSESTLSLYLNGKMKLPAEILARICSFTGISVDEVLRGEDTEE